MQIIKPGDPEMVLRYKYFMCMDCGCEFMADSTEYDCIGVLDGGNYYRCKCPCCGALVYMNENTTRGVYDFSYTP